MEITRSRGGDRGVPIGQANDRRQICCGVGRVCAVWVHQIEGGQAVAMRESPDKIKLSLMVERDAAIRTEAAAAAD